MTRGCQLRYKRDGVGGSPPPPHMGVDEKKFGALCTPALFFLLINTKSNENL